MANTWTTSSPPRAVAKWPTSTPALIETVERELFARAIRQAQGNQAKAARWLGVTRVTMKAKLVQFGLHTANDTELE